MALPCSVSTPPIHNKSGRGSLLLANRAFPKDFAAAMSTAEEAGTLDKELRRWSNHYSARAVEGFARLEAWLPKIIYAVICCYVVWQIVQAYMGYLNLITADPLDF